VPRQNGPTAPRVPRVTVHGDSGSLRDGSVTSNCIDRPGILYVGDVASAVQTAEAVPGRFQSDAGMVP
jgi:hypothetical protein